VAADHELALAQQPLQAAHHHFDDYDVVVFGTASRRGPRICSDASEALDELVARLLEDNCANCGRVAVAEREQKLDAVRRAQRRRRLSVAPAPPDRPCGWMFAKS
jgi:hypothetical protein